MKKVIIQNIMNSIEKKENYSEKKLGEIKYGLESLYLTITKTIIIFLLAYFIGIFKELLFVILFYGVLRMTGFGLHTKKSWQCWLSSGIIFLLIPYLVKILTINFSTRLIISAICIVFLAIFAPSDTEKRPLIRKNRRIIYKLLTVIIAIGFAIYSFMITNQLIQNAILFALLIECFVISPLTYKIFRLRYANYKYYKKSLSA